MLKRSHRGTCLSGLALLLPWCLLCWSLGVRETCAAEAPPAGPAAEAEAAAPVAAPTEVETVDGLVSVPAAALGALSVRKAGDEHLLRIGGRVLKLRDVLSVHFPGEPVVGGRAVLFLRGGGELAGTVASGNENGLDWRNEALGDDPLPVRLESIRGLLIRHEPGRNSTEGLRDSRARESAFEVRLRNSILTARAQEDEVVLFEGGKIPGILVSVDAKGVRFDSETLGDEVLLGFERLRAVVLADLEEDSGDGEPAPSPNAPSPAKLPPVRLALADGSELPGDLVEIAAGAVTLLHPDLGQRTIALRHVKSVAFLGGRARYLSDVDPVNVREELGFLFRLKMPYRRDTSVVGTPLTLGGRVYRKGLGVHSYSLLEYDLGAKYSQFRAIVGLDTTAHPPADAPGREDMGSVVFRVRLDGRVLLDKALTWRDPPVPVDIDLRGGKLLSLEVDYGGAEGGFNPALDRANWANARIIK